MERPTWVGSWWRRETFILTRIFHVLEQSTWKLYGRSAVATCEVFSLQGKEIALSDNNSYKCFSQLTLTFPLSPPTIALLPTNPLPPQQPLPPTEHLNPPLFAMLPTFRHWHLYSSLSFTVEMKKQDILFINSFILMFPKPLFVGCLHKCMCSKYKYRTHSFE